MKILLLLLSLFLYVSCAGKKQNEKKFPHPAELKKLCQKDFNQMKGFAHNSAVCAKVEQLPGCKSERGIPIYHMDQKSKNKQAQRILTFALIHGDEGDSGLVAQVWMERLLKIDPQNHWRVIPVLNPDGWHSKSRTNANKIDLNRNFPTKNWEKNAPKRWKRKNFDARRYPGKKPNSERETQCAIRHIKTFKPSFIISLHTPYGVLDFDGPQMHFPTFKPLPWISLGHYPGSMGRYMWKERNVPVLTIELKERNVNNLEKFDQLQDIAGIVAIQSKKILRKKQKSKDHEK